MGQRRTLFLEGLYVAVRETLPIDLSVEGFFYHLRLIDETDNAHLSLALGAGERVCCIDLSYEVGPTLL